MSDFAGESSQEALRLQTKSIEGLFKLLKWLMEAEGRKLTRQTQKIKIAEAKDSKTKTEGKIPAYKAGYVAAQKLIDSGDPLAWASTKMNEADFKEFAAHAGREGLIFTALESPGAGGGIEYTMAFREKDLAHAKSIVERMNKDALEKAALQNAAKEDIVEGERIGGGKELEREDIKEGERMGGGKDKMTMDEWKNEINARRNQNTRQPDKEPSKDRDKSKNSKDER